MIKSESGSTKSTKGTAAAHRPTAEEIAIRAHQIFTERGAQPGRDVEDWLQAERELSQNGSNRAQRGDSRLAKR